MGHITNVGFVVKHQLYWSLFEAKPKNVDTFYLNSKYEFYENPFDAIRTVPSHLTQYFPQFLILKTLSPCSSPNFWVKISHHYNTIGTIMVLLISKRMKVRKGWVTCSKPPVRRFGVIFFSNLTSPIPSQLEELQGLRWRKEFAISRPTQDCGKEVRGSGGRYAFPIFFHLLNLLAVCLEVILLPPSLWIRLTEDT